MPGQINHFQVRPMQAWGPGVTQRKHIAAIFGMKPNMMDDIMVRAFTANNCPTMETLLKQHTSVRVFDNDEEFTWRMTGTTYKNIPLVEARDENGTVINSGTSGNIGQGATVIQLVFPEAYFADQEVIVGELNEYYQFRILGEPVMEGSYAVYDVELMAGAETGIPAERLLPGERFSEEFALVEKELSRKAGGIRKSVPTSLRNEWTKLRKYNKVTGGAKELKLEMSIPLMNRDENGNIVKRTVDSWFYNEEWIFNDEWRREKSRAIMYSRSNRNSNGNYFNHGKSGNVIKICVTL